MAAVAANPAKVADRIAGSRLHAQHHRNRMAVVSGAKTRTHQSHPAVLAHVSVLYLLACLSYRCNNTILSEHDARWSTYFLSWDVESTVSRFLGRDVRNDVEYDQPA
jgi:hypothetical protein